jgi:hypothetical protein
MDWLRNAWTNYITGATERFEGYRTHLFAFLTFLLGLLEVVDPYALAGILPYQYHGYVFIGFGVLTFLLRQITKTESPVRFTRRKRDASEPGEGTYVYEADGDADGGDGE